MPQLDCLVIGYSELSRDRERKLFYEGHDQPGGWSRFLNLNYVSFENDIMLANHLASIAYLRGRGSVEKTPEGFFKNTDISTFSAWQIPLLGGVYVYQYLKSLNFTAALIQHAQLEANALVEQLRQGPRVIAISTTLIMEPQAILEIVRYCRRLSPESFIVLGGMTVWNAWLGKKERCKSYFRAMEADAVVLDPRGIRTLATLLTRVKRGSSLKVVPNLVITAGGRCADATFQEPEPFDFRSGGVHWDLVDDHILKNITFVRTQISCPFSCSFCSYPVTQGPVIQNEMDLFEAELQTLSKRGVQHLLFVDDTFNVPIRRFKGMLSILRKFDFRWYAFIRCQYLEDEDVKCMKESGCAGVYLGIEAADDVILENMNKKCTVKKYRHGISAMAREGITMYASFIVGFPGETEQTVVKTRDFIESTEIDFYNIKVFYYEHSTPIRNRAEEFKLVGSGQHWRHKTMTSDQAFGLAERLVSEIRTKPYCSLLGGEYYEIAYFRSQGFSDTAIHTIYRTYTNMLQNQLSSAPDRPQKQEKLFAELVSHLAP